MAEKALQKLIILVVSQINLLQCRMSDFIDLKLLEQGKFVLRAEQFSPLETLWFVIRLFN